MEQCGGRERSARAALAGRRMMRARIEKRAEAALHFRRRVVYFPRARDAFHEALRSMSVPECGGVLLPAYIGWSPKEGSGVFDPIGELHAPYSFYRMNQWLQIDIECLQRQLTRTHPRVLLLIHYFGYPDAAFREAAALASAVGTLVVEDEAHSMLSDVVGGICGREGQAAFFSLHKLLPVTNGGLLVRNGAEPGGDDPIVADSVGAGAGWPWEYDLASVAAVRVRNTRFLLRALAPLADDLDPLRPALPPGVVPQTLPIVLKKAPRDEVYTLMNRAGYGVVSLYHTMIAELPASEYQDAHWLAKRILNLPVHQDATLEALGEMVRYLQQLLARWH